MTKIKICGISRFCDVEYVNELLPEYVGFVFAKSKRQVDLTHAYKLIKDLNAKIKKVGVFVDEDPSVALAIAKRLELDVLQFHGHEKQDYINKFKAYEIWKAVKISDIDSISEINNYKCEKYLLDNSISGSGESFNWDLVKKEIDGFTIMLAGGLNSKNVAQGILKLKPYGVDVSSGIETNGFKDYEKIKEFIKKVRDL